MDLTSTYIWVIVQKMSHTGWNHSFVFMSLHYVIVFDRKNPCKQFNWNLYWKAILPHYTTVCIHTLTRYEIIKEMTIFKQQYAFTRTICLLIIRPQHRKPEWLGGNEALSLLHYFSRHSDCVEIPIKWNYDISLKCPI